MVPLPGLLAVLAQRGLRGVAHTRDGSSIRIKGVTDTRHAEETLFLLYTQAIVTRG